MTQTVIRARNVRYTDRLLGISNPESTVSVFMSDESDKIAFQIDPPKCEWSESEDHTRRTVGAADPTQLTILFGVDDAEEIADMLKEAIRDKRKLDKRRAKIDAKRAPAPLQRG